MRRAFFFFFFFFCFAMALGGCAPISRSPNDLATTSAGLGRTVRIEPGLAHGPDTDLERFDDELRGVWAGARVSVRLSNDRVIGLVDSRPLDLHVKEEAATPSSSFVAHGLIGSRLGDISLTARELRASIDGCGYELERVTAEREEDARTYRGYRCGSIPTSVTLPESWGSIPVTERATYLALLLMR